MTSLAIGGYAVRTVLRNRRTTASALVGLVLGVAVDSSIRGLFNWYLDRVAVDVGARGSGEFVANATRDLAAVPNVERVEPTYLDYGPLNLTSIFISGVEVHFVGSSFGQVLDRLGIYWSAPP